MALTTGQTAAGAALIAALMASAGGYLFLKQHPNPTLREVFKACEGGTVSGIVCCEDMLRVKNQNNYANECGMVSPQNPDPFGVRGNEEDDWDALVAKQKEAAQ